MSSGRKILVVGSGGREHALALRLLASPSVAEVIGCPGNAGLSPTFARDATKVLRCLEGDPLVVAQAEKVDLVVIGPEVPLCEGLADEFASVGIPCFGPSKKAAQLEGSKAFMKEFCRRHFIRAANDVIVSSLAELEAGLAQFSVPPVVKADGLCAGKGVVVAETMAEAREAATEMLNGSSFGQAGATVVLEERLFGQETSIHAICDGERALVLPAAQDHKRIGEGDTGPNTGGMGTYAPAPVVSDRMLAAIKEDVVDAVVAGMKADGIAFVGALFAGLMINEQNEAVVLEFNVRFGDPETQVLTQIIDGDLGEALYQAATGCLEEGVLTTSGRHALCVVLAAAGYPNAPRKGDRIEGVELAAQLPGVEVFHAGTALEDDKLLTRGGRVLGVTASAPSLKEARDLAYRAADMIQFTGKQMRRDIGYRALAAK